MLTKKVEFPTGKPGTLKDYAEPHQIETLKKKMSVKALNK